MCDRDGGPRVLSLACSGGDEGSIDASPAARKDPAMTTLAVGTVKGAFLLRPEGRGWDVRGPLFPGWEVTAFGRAADGTHLAAVASGWFGPAIHRSGDLAEWEQVADGPAWPEGADRKLNRVWFFHRDGDALWCGVDDAGVFRSDDHGLSWRSLEGLNEHPSRAGWSPGGGGLCAHHMLTAGDRMWVGISAVGVMRSDDGGATFARRDDGIQPVVASEDEPFDGSCVHGLVADPANPSRIWRMDHSGVYRTADGGDSWHRIERGLPAAFGFPVARDDASGALFLAPLAADVNRLPVDGRFRVYRSTDDGDTWHVSGAGWSDEPTFTSVLRRAMCTDGAGGVYVGTTGGAVWASGDAGDGWREVPARFPRILTVAALG